TVGLLDCLTNYDGVVIGIGNNKIRQTKLLMLERAGANLVGIIHPAAAVSRYAEVGLGTVAFASAVLNAGARVGAGVILNTGSSVDHDCVLGDCGHVSAGARLAGGVKVGNLAWLGIGSSVRQLVNIGAGAMVAAGAVVIDDVPQDAMVAGVPARVISQ